MQDSQVTYRRLFRNRSFMALWLGQTISFVGDYFYWLAIPIMVERLTGSALLVGLSVISNALPMLLLGPVAGVFVDRWNRKHTMIVSDLLRGLLVLLCLTVQSPEQVWVFYVVGFLMSSVSRFFFPSQNAVLPLIVPDKHDLLTANGLMQIVQTVGMLVGPAIAGFAIALWGERVAFLVDSTTFFVSALAILIMTVPRTTHGRQVAEGTGGKLDAVWAELREGVVYLFGSRVMVGVLLCMSVVQLGLGAINVLWVPFMQRTFGLGPEGLGAVDVAQGVGMAAGGLLLGFVATRMRKKDLAGWSIVLAGVAIVLIGLSPALSLATWLTVQDGSVAMDAMSVAQRLLYMPLLLLLFSMLVGVAIVPAQSSLMTMMQLAVPDLKRGRVGSALNALTTMAGLISMALAAALGEVVALRVIYVIAGLVVVGAGLVGLVVLQEPDPQPGDLEQVEVPGLAMGGASD
ncbi:MAG: MFS transporter [Anaerolineae bacterium]|jgi:MFS family permease